MGNFDCLTHEKQITALQHKADKNSERINGMEDWITELRDHWVKAFDDQQKQIEALQERLTALERLLPPGQEIVLFGDSGNYGGIEL